MDPGPLTCSARPGLQARTVARKSLREGFAGNGIHVSCGRESSEFPAAVQWLLRDDDLFAAGHVNFDTTVRLQAGDQFLADRTFAVFNFCHRLGFADAS